MCDTATVALIAPYTTQQQQIRKILYNHPPVETSAFSDPMNTIENSSPFQKWNARVPRMLIYPGAPLFKEAIVPRMYQSALQSPLTTFTDLRY